jgi:Zn-dependent protease with chaperone function
VGESRGLRRAEFAVAAFGLTGLLVGVVLAVDAVRFHREVLVDALAALPHGELHARGMLLIALAVFDVLALSRAAGSLGRGVRAHRRVVGGMPVVAALDVAGRTVRIVPGAEPRAFCAGLLRPGVYVSEGALARLGPRELAAVVAHEGHHADRRDPLRILVARAIGAAYAARAQALAELAADAVAARRAGTAPLASALLSFGVVAPERVDRLAGAPPRGEVSRALVIGTAAVVVVLVAVLAEVLSIAHPPFCLPLASAPGVILCALAPLGPAWLGWRRAGAYLR